ncbi:MAG TPA: hypothetical protein VIO11_09720 [Candidatus Methanoperedens sp.]
MSFTKAKQFDPETGQKVAEEDETERIVEISVTYESKPGSF